MSSQRPRRRQKIVDAKFQLGLGFQLVGFIYLYVVLFAVAANASSLASIFVADIEDPAYAESVIALRGFAQFIVLPLVLTFVVTALHAVLITHRIAGPIHRAKAVLRDMARRRFPAEVRFRDKDFLQDLGEEMTVTLTALREDQARVRRMNEETALAARTLVVAAESGVAADRLESLAHAVLDAAERLDRHVAPLSDDDPLAQLDRQLDRVPVPAAELPEAALAPDA